MKPYVSLGAVLYKLIAGPVPAGAKFMGYGRNVTKTGSHIDAPYVSLYRHATGYFAK